MTQARARMLGVFLVVTGGAACGVSAHPGAQPGHVCVAGPTAPGIEMVHACWPDEHGNLTGRLIPLETLTPENIALRAELDKNYARGLGERIDLVFVGDGYTASEQSVFHAHVDDVVANMFVYEPFTTYEPYFRIQRVEVVSEVSGVSGDPSASVFRDTPLQMAYWCGGTERALCVNVNRALNSARNGVVTDVDQVIALANSTKYGGVGYPQNNLGTAAGGNSAATQIVIHELGHSLGDLADEYTYGGSTNYSGPELGPFNVSIYNANQLAQQERKWFRWLGASLPGFDGTVGAFVGGNYSETGVYRPTNNSMMRALSRPFNLPSAEGLIKEFYREVSPIDDATPGEDVDGSDTVFAVPMQPNGHDLDIFWEVDGVRITSLDGQTHVDLAALGLDDGVERVLRVTVTDPTPWVRDPVTRETMLTERREWVVNRCINRADINESGGINVFDLYIYLAYYELNDPIADFDASGVIDVFDLLRFLIEYNNPCPV